MIQKNSRTIILSIACLGLFGVLAEAQNTSPNSARNTPQNTAPNTTQNNLPNPGPNARRGAKPNQRAPGQVPPGLNGGVAALQSAKSSLEQAGDKWGGHRIKAIFLIDKALTLCGQTKVRTAGEMKSGPQDQPALIQQGIAQLTNAQNVFAKATGNAQMPKVNALISQALQELQTALTLANGQQMRSRK